MNLLTHLLASHPKHLMLPEELHRSITALADEEGVSACELIASLTNEAARLRKTAESVPRRWKSLTPREQQVVRLVCRKLSNAEIAERLGISPDTVKAHLQNAKNKLDIHSKDLLQRALAGFDFGQWED